MKARLEVDPFEPEALANLYIPVEEFKKLVKQLGTNRLTVVLRFEGE